MQTDFRVFMVGWVALMLGVFPARADVDSDRILGRVIETYADAAKFTVDVESRVEMSGALRWRLTRAVEKGMMFVYQSQVYSNSGQSTDVGLVVAADATGKITAVRPSIEQNVGTPLLSLFTDKRSRQSMELNGDGMLVLLLAASTGAAERPEDRAVVLADFRSAWIAGSVPVDGRTLLVIARRTANGAAFLLIDEKRFTLARSITFRRSAENTVRVIGESVYKTAFTSPTAKEQWSVRSWSDILLPEAYSGEDYLGERKAKEIYQMALNSAPKFQDAGSSQSAAEPADAPAPPPPATTPPASLTTAQRAAIVLIEKSDVTGAGFIADMKGKRFMVTRAPLACLEQGAKFRTLGGRDIEPGSMFLAGGRDVVISRLADGAQSDALPLPEKIDDVLAIGTEVMVVGNGGGVPRQIVAKIKELGPDKFILDAAYHADFGGGPIIHGPTGVVLGISAYAEGSSRGGRSGANGASGAWVAYRMDGISQWTPIDAAKWRAQRQKLEDLSLTLADFRAVADANLNMVARDPDLQAIVDDVNRAFKDYSLRGQESQQRLCRKVLETALARLRVAESAITGVAWYDFFMTTEDAAYSVQFVRADVSLLRGQVESHLKQFDVYFNRVGVNCRKAQMVRDSL